MVSFVMGTVLPHVPSGFFSEILASRRGATRKPEKTTVPSRADSGRFILGGKLGVATGGDGATGRGRGRGGAAVGGAGTPGRGGTGGDASGDGVGAGRAAGGVGSGGGAIGRGSGSGGAAVLKGAATGCGTGSGGAATGGGAAGRGVPQYPQNLLPEGNDFWQFGHTTWGMAETGGRIGGAGNSVEAGCGPTFWGFPQRAQAGADAGFIAPQDAQRM